MDSYGVAKARAQLGALLERVSAGEQIEIRKHGRPMALLVPVRHAKKPLDVAKLRALTDRMKMSDHSGVEILRQMRDSR